MTNVIEAAKTVEDLMPNQPFFVKIETMQKITNQTPEECSKALIEYQHSQEL